MKIFSFIVLILLTVLSCKNRTDYETIVYPGKPGVPPSILAQHDSLLQQLATFIVFDDSTGRTARKLEQLIKDHFREEEDYILPPLSVLPLLAEGKMPEEKEKMILLIKRFRENSAHILAEHQFIKVYLEELTAAASKENHPEVLGFEKAIHAHAGMEEEILFPAVLAIGKFLEENEIKK